MIFGIFGFVIIMVVIMFLGRLVLMNNCFSVNV